METRVNRKSNKRKILIVFVVSLYRKNVISLIFFFIFLWSKRHRDFIGKANEISQGMTYNEVLSIMDVSPTSIEEDGNKKILIWEKNQWKGIQNGGTLTRAIKVVFENDLVVSISTKNLDESTFF